MLKANCNIFLNKAHFNEKMNNGAQRETPVQYATHQLMCHCYCTILLLVIFRTGTQWTLIIKSSGRDHPPQLNPCSLPFQKAPVRMLLPQLGSEAGCSGAWPIYRENKKGVSNWFRIFLFQSITCYAVSTLSDQIAWWEWNERTDTFLVILLHPSWQSTPPQGAQGATGALSCAHWTGTSGLHHINENN